MCTLISVVKCSNRFDKGTNQYGVFGLILYVPVNSYGHVGIVT